MRLPTASNAARMGGKSVGDTQGGVLAGMSLGFDMNRGCCISMGSYAVRAAGGSWYACSCGVVRRRWMVL